MSSEIKERILNLSEKLFFRLPLYGKIISVLIVLCIFFITARIGYFGSEIQSFSQRLLPFRIPLVDAPKSDILLTFYFQVNSANGWKRGVLGQRYAADSEMALSFNTNIPCWLLFIGIDSNGYYPIPIHKSKQSYFTPIYFEPLKEPQPIPFKLDGTIGPEIYIAIASHRNFDFQNEVKPALDENFKPKGGKGASFGHQLSLGPGFYQRAVYFDTVESK